MSTQKLRRSFQTALCGLEDIQDKEVEIRNEIDSTLRIYADWQMEHGFWTENWARFHLCTFSNYAWPKKMYAAWCESNGDTDRAERIHNQDYRMTWSLRREPLTGVDLLFLLAPQRPAGQNETFDGECDLRRRWIHQDLARCNVQIPDADESVPVLLLQTTHTFITSVTGLSLESWREHGHRIIRHHPLRFLSLREDKPFVVEKDGRWFIEPLNLPYYVLNAIAAKNEPISGCSNRTSAVGYVMRACLWAASQTPRRRKELGFS